MINSDLFEDFSKTVEAYARLQKKKSQIPEGDDLLKHMSKKDRALLDKGMKRFLGYGVDGPPSFIPFNETRTRR
ncbi:MAG: hypothetical protein ACSHX9_00345 [Luteolibacter sp.]